MELDFLIRCSPPQFTATTLTPRNPASAGTMAMAPVVEATRLTRDAASSAFFGRCPRPEKTMRCQNVLKLLVSISLTRLRFASVVSFATAMTTLLPSCQ